MHPVLIYIKYAARTFTGTAAAVAVGQWAAAAAAAGVCRVKRINTAPAVPPHDYLHTPKPVYLHYAYTRISVRACVRARARA